jgi:hypothetical protein
MAPLIAAGDDGPDESPQLAQALLLRTEQLGAVLLRTQAERRVVEVGRDLTGARVVRRDTAEP